MRRFAGSRRPRHAAPSGSLDTAILALSPYSFFAADYYSVDGVSGKVAAFLDKVASGTGIKAFTSDHAMAQSTSAQQVAVPTADAALNGQKSATFMGSQRYDSSSTAARWKLLHDGTGCDVVHTYVITSVSGAQASLATRSGAAVGLVINRSAAVYTAVARNDSGTIISSSGGTSALGAVCQRYSYSESASPEWTHRAGGSNIGTGSSSLAPTSSDPQAVLRLGATAAGTDGDLSRWACTIVFSRVLSSGDWARVQQYLLTKYMVAA